jgi:hypothetical protein
MTKADRGDLVMWNDYARMLGEWVFWIGRTDEKNKGISF